MITPQRFAAYLLRAGALVLFSAVVIGAFTTTTVAQPRIQIVGGDTVNWGRIAADTLKHTITIVNTGDGVLEISEVRPSCGCTTTEKLSKNSLAPNDTATVGIAINVKGHHGPQLKRVTITSNDPDSARASLAMIFRADLLQSVAANATMFTMIREAKIGNDYRSNVELRNVGDEPVTIRPPRAAAGDDVAISFDLVAPRTLQPGETLDLVAHVTPRTPGMHTTEITVPTSGKYTPELNLKVITQVVDPDAAARSASAPAQSK